MKRLTSTYISVFTLFLLISCSGTLPVQISPVLSTINPDGIIKKTVTMGYIPLSANKKEILLEVFYMSFGAADYKLKLYPYRDSHHAFKKVLSNVYKKTIAVTDQIKPFTSDKNIDYLISINNFKITTDSDIPEDLPPLFTIFVPSAGTIFPHNASISFWSDISDRAGNIIMHKEFTGIGQATQSEIEKGGNTIILSRALSSAFLSLQKELVKMELPQ